MRSRIYSFKHIKTESKGKGWIPVALLLGFLLAFPVAILLKLGNWKDVGYTADQIVILYENLWKDGMAFTGAAVAGVAAICNSVSGFCYLYSGKKTDFYHSLPVKRSRAFWHKVYVGILYYLIPYLIMEFLAVCIGAAKGFFSLKLMLMAVKLLGLHLLIYLLIYFSMVLVFCVTGNALTGILSLVFLGLYGESLGFLLTIYGETFFKTFYRDNTYNILNLIAGRGTPQGFILDMLLKYREGSGRYFLVMLAVIIVLMILSCVAYIKRPSEAAGRSMVYSWVAVLLRFIVVVPFGLGIGWIFYSITAESSRLIWWIFGMLLGTVLAHGMMETVYQMSFQGFFRKKRQLVIAGVLVVICAAFYKCDLGKYDLYCPGQKDLAAVNVSMINYASDFCGYAEKNKDGTYTYTESFKWDSPVFALSDKKGGIGDETYKTIQKIVADNDAVRDEQTKGTAYSIYLKYTLKSGKNTCRNYAIQSETMRELLKDLYNEENLKDQKYDFLKIDPEYVNSVEFSAADGDSHNIYSTDSTVQELEQLREAMQKDVEAASADDLIQVPVGQLDFFYSLPAPTDVNSMVPNPEYVNKNYATWTVFVYPSFKNTLEILKKTGYPLSIDELDITGIKLHYLMPDSVGDESGDIVVEYTSRSEIAELKKAMLPAVGVYTGLGEDSVNSITVEAQIKNKENALVTELMKDRLPDFVREKMQELGIGTDESVTSEQPESVTEDEYAEDDISTN